MSAANFLFKVSLLFGGMDAFVSGTGSAKNCQRVTKPMRSITVN